MPVNGRFPLPRGRGGCCWDECSESYFSAIARVESFVGGETQDERKKRGRKREDLRVRLFGVRGVKWCPVSCLTHGRGAQDPWRIEWMDKAASQSNGTTIAESLKPVVRASPQGDLRLGRRYSLSAGSLLLRRDQGSPCFEDALLGHRAGRRERSRPVATNVQGRGPGLRRS